MNALSCRIAAALVTAASAMTSATRADEPIKTPSRSDDAVVQETHRAIYLARNTSAGSLVYLLEKHFEGTDGLKFVAEPSANLLSIRVGSQAVLDEVLKTLVQIDKPPRQVVVQVLLVEFTQKKWDAANVEVAKSPVNTDELVGSADEVRAKVNRWAIDGHVASVRKFELKAVENSPSQVFVGEERPVPTGFTNSATGMAIPSLQIRNFGTAVNVMSRITDGDRIQMTLHIQDNQQQSLESGIELAKGANGPIVSRGTAIKQLTTTLEIENGGSNVATGIQTGLASGQPPGLFVVSARVVGSVPPPRTAGVESSREPAPTTARTASPDATPGGSLNTRGSNEASGPTVGGPRSRPSFASSASFFSAMRDEEFVKQLKLTDEQHAQVVQLRTEMFTALRSGGTAETMPAIMKEFEQKGVDLLTTEQKKLWTERLAERLKNAKEAEVPGSAPPSSPPATKPAAAEPSRSETSSNRRGTAVRSGARGRAGLTPEAQLTELNEILVKRPHDGGSLERRAEIHVQLGNLDQAISDLRTVIIAGRENSWRGDAIHFDLAMLLAYRGDQAGSRESLRQFVASRTQISMSSIALAWLMTRDSPSDQRAFTIKLQQPRAIAIPTGLNEQFDLSQMRMGLSDGVAHLARGQPLLAISCFESHLNISPNLRAARSENESRVRICLALALLSVGDSDRADTILREAEAKLESIPTSIASVADHVLLKQARAELAATK